METIGFLTILEDYKEKDDTVYFCMNGIDFCAKVKELNYVKKYILFVSVKKIAGAVTLNGTIFNELPYAEELVVKVDKIDYMFKPDFKKDK